MDGLFWAMIVFGVVGIAAAGCVTYINRKEKDAEWAAGVFGIVCSSAMLAIGTVQSLIADAAEARAGKRIAELEQFTRGNMDVGQWNALAQSGLPPEQDFVVEVRASKFDNLAQGWAGGIADSLQTAGWIAFADVFRERPIRHKGIVIFAKEDSPALRELKRRLRSVGIEFAAEVVKGFDQMFGEHNDAVISVGDVKK